jgi:hypothetical protein
MGSVVEPTYLADPAEAEVAFQDKIKLLLNTERGDVTAKLQTVSNGAVLGTEKWYWRKMNLKVEDSIKL